jgi:hypothetical protein
MRFESATVPAAVMPDRSNDDGLWKSCHCSPAGGWEGFINRDKSEDLPCIFNIQSFREEKRRINY